MLKMAETVKTVIGGIGNVWKAAALPNVSDNKLRAPPPPTITREALLKAFKEQRIAIFNSTTRKMSRVTIPADVIALVTSALANTPPKTDSTLLAENGGRIILENEAGAIRPE